jgi:hydrogenase/urease accessory protein HupE
VSRRIAWCLLAIAVSAGAAHAHRLSPAYFGFTETAPGVFDVQWKVSVSGGLVDVLEPKVPDGCTLAGGVRSYVVDDARLQHGAIVCEGGLQGKTFTVGGLDATATDVLLRVDYLDAPSFTHRLVPGSPSVVIPAEAGTAEIAGTYFVLGVEHILLGFDHLLFVFGLLLLVNGIGRLVATITSFTLAHTVTLGAATLGFVHVPSAPVEATIALSILFLAVELAREQAGALAGDPDAARSLTARFPWLVAFSFGLLHGFGFAGALSEIGLPERAIPLALLFFNVGVEAGQLAFVAAVVGLKWAVETSAVTVPRWSPRLAAYVIGSVAAYWVIERSAAYV